jgi:pyridoxal phosphate enzyme (YggS family)
VTDGNALAAARAEILGRIGEAAERAGRDPGDVEIVAITKTVPVAGIREALEAGFRELGENRVQERQAKAGELDAATTYPAGEAPRWHLVGPLQSNKARRAIELFDVIETVDSLELAQRLDRLAREIRGGRPYPVLLQVNVDEDTAKSGFEPGVLERDLPAILDLADITVDGLMTVGRFVESAEAARPTFVGLRELSERLRARHGRLGAALSMGMSGDFGVAVEEGATLVRIGSAIFGARPTG